MKKFLSLVLTFTVSFLGLLSLMAQPVRAQEIARVGKSISEMKAEYERFLAVDRDPSTPTEVKEVNHQLLETRRTQLRAAIESRLGALKKYQSAMNGTLSSEESLVVGNSIQALERDLSALSGETKSPAAPATTAAAPRARVISAASTTPPVSDKTAPTSPAPKAETVFPGSLTPQVPPTISFQWTGTTTVNSPYISLPFTVNDSTVLISALNLVVDGPNSQKSSTTIRLARQNDQGIVRVVRDVLNVTLFNGANTITLSDAGDSGAAPATITITYTGAARAPDTGNVVGLLLGGVVISQQAGKFSQADPFMGFNAGYSGLLIKKIDARLHGRFQGIFQSEAKKDEAPPRDIVAPNPTDFKPFLASRKAFNIEGDIWLDMPFNRSEHVYWGPYFAWGASTYMDKNELLGDEGVKVPNKDLGPSATPTPTPTPGGAGSDATELDPSRAKIDNDLNAYKEAGFIVNIFGDRRGNRGERPSQMFLQAIFAYGKYEGLAGLYNGGPNSGFWKDSSNRFVGKLRIFPSFLLGSNPDSTADFMPMFGVELNAGRGPDQLKFFTGVAIPLGKFKKLGFGGSGNSGGGSNGGGGGSGGGNGAAPSPSPTP